MAKHTNIKAGDGQLVPDDYVALGAEIRDTLTKEGVKVRYLYWTHPHVLEVKVHGKENYKKALDIMSMECPTEASSLFGIESERELLFQFDMV